MAQKKSQKKPKAKSGVKPRKKTAKGSLKKTARSSLKKTIRRSPGKKQKKSTGMRSVELAFGGLIGLAFATIILILYGEQIVTYYEQLTGDAAGVGEEAEPETVVRDLQPDAVGMPEFAGEPNWERYAAVSPEIGRLIPIAIVIDDLGLDRGIARRLAAMDGPLTFSFLPYAGGLQSQVDMVKARGHEVLLHLPMEPHSSDADPGPHALYLGLSDEETLERMVWNLARIRGYVGVNNHMGSEYTENASYMGIVLSAIGAQGLMFLDSRTSARSVAGLLASRMGIATAERDVFLDNERNRAAILSALAQTERIAGDRGFAVAIGHPYPETLAALESWMEGLEGRGFVLVPITVIVRFTESERLDGVGQARD